MIRSRHHISPEYDLMSWRLVSDPFNPFPNGFDLSVDALEAGLKFFFYPLLVSCLGVNLDIARAKAREAEQSLAVVHLALQKADNSLTEECSVAPEKAWATITQYKETLSFKLGLKKMGQVIYEYGYRVILAFFLARYPQLEVEEGPDTILPEDDDVPMEVEVPFDDSDPPTA
ncbi:hypothetical protein B296_00024766 [Ensete ventricosum]|uniref:Uncharacterized protein n=1 Tax=Ensete ventricosum TaxID=4639 RepID=A0A426YHN5_ENSVE|nr:hypothetical protein B296_00024766 [Ensete ventricosum]